MLVSFKPDIAGVFPSWAQVFVSSGVTVGALTAIVLNILFFHLGRQRGANVATDAAGRRIGIEDVNAMDRDEFVGTFGTLFNGATWPLERAWEARPLRRRPFPARRDRGRGTATAERAVDELSDMATPAHGRRGAGGVISQDVGSLRWRTSPTRTSRRCATSPPGTRSLDALRLLPGRTDSFGKIIADGVRRLDHSPRTSAACVTGSPRSPGTASGSWWPTDPIGSPDPQVRVAAVVGLRPASPRRQRTNRFAREVWSRGVGLPRAPVPRGDSIRPTRPDPSAQDRARHDPSGSPARPAPCAGQLPRPRYR